VLSSACEHIERNGLVRVAAEAPHFEMEVTSIQRVAQCRRWLRRPTEAEHALVPYFAREPIGLLAGFLGTRCGRTNWCAVNRMAGFGGHPT